MFLVGDCTLDQRYVDRFGVGFDVGDRAVHHLDALGQVKQPFVKVEKRHVAAGTTAQPYRRHAQFVHGKRSFRAFII